MNFIIAISLGLTFVLGFLIQHVEALDIIVSHGGKGEIDLCMESDGYDDSCADFNLIEWASPFMYTLDVEDPDEGHDFSVCYEFKDSDFDFDFDFDKTCRDFEFTGSADQRINFNIPDINPASGIPEEDFSLRDPSNLLGPTVPSTSELPPVPSSPPP
jgi:hypothetical protein